MNKIVKIVASLTFLLLSTTIAASDHEAKQQLQPGLYWQSMPVVCGHIDSVNSYIEQYNFLPENQTAGRANAKITGNPVYVVTYFINVDRSETLATIHVPGDPEVCMIFRSFNLHWFKQDDKDDVKPQSNVPDWPIPPEEVPDLKENKDIQIPLEEFKKKGINANYMLIEME